MASNTPVPKRLRGPCPLDEGNAPCIGNKCRFIKKNCLYQKMLRELHKDPQFLYKLTRVHIRIVYDEEIV